MSKFLDDCYASTNFRIGVDNKCESNNFLIESNLQLGFLNR